MSLYDRAKIEELFKDPPGLRTPKIDWVGHKKIFFGVSCAIIAIAIIASFIFGVSIDIKFTGGTIGSYSYVNQLDEDTFESTIQDITGYDVSVAGSKDLMTGNDTFTVNFPKSVALDVEDQNDLYDGLLAAFPDNNIEVVSVNSVSPTMGGDFLLKCLVAVAFASIVMVIYVGIRFRKIGGISAGLFALLALVHDLAMVYAAFVFFRMPLDDNFMAIMLVILGYSVNDTIIIYDRVRENESIHGNKLSSTELLNISINQSLSRSLHTSATTIMAMTLVLIFALINGVDSIVTFTLPLIVGLISGTYSTLCIAGPAWVTWKEWRAKKKAR